jgi:hypothetical protein
MSEVTFWCLSKRSIITRKFHMNNILFMVYVLTLAMLTYNFAVKVKVLYSAESISYNHCATFCGKIS